MKTAESSVTGTRFLATFGVAFLAIGGLFGVDTFLAGLDESESHAEAARLFNEGRRLMEDGKDAQAVNRLEDAVEIERNNRDYRQALAEAMLAAGRISDAENALTDLLADDSTDGKTNLTMARLMVRAGRVPDAISFYHRAIYGRWKDDAAARQLSARFELIDLLAKSGSKAELLAELLPVQEEEPADPATKTRTGRLFLEAGTPARAAAVFRDVLHDQPRDADAYTGLGEAEFAMGNYRASASHFSSALRLNPSDQEARAKREICEQILGLDPSRRGLSTGQRFERSEIVLQMTVDAAAQCLAGHSSAETSALLDQARIALKQRVRPVDQADVLDSNLDLSEQLWQSAEKICALGQKNEALSLLMAQLAK